MPESGLTLQSIAADVRRVERQIADRPTMREMDDVKDDVKALASKLDRIIENQLADQRAKNLQLVAIIATFLVAGYGALFA